MNPDSSTLWVSILLHSCEGKGDGETGQKSINGKRRRRPLKFLSVLPCKPAVGLPTLAPRFIFNFPAFEKLGGRAWEMGHFSLIGNGIWETFSYDKIPL